MANLQLQIITPQKEVLAAETAFVVLPGMMGELGILPDHIPLVTTLDSGVLRYGRDGREVAVAIHYGYAEVESNKVTVLAEMAELAEDIDRARAANAEQKARTQLQSLLKEQQVEEYRMKKYESKLKRATIRQMVAGN
ncbi:MAG TPA: F0F1 ATP synthase subunit epsilon [bacterium]